MKLTYLGTAAAEGFPALFCRCAYCLEARRLGGKNIRTRSQSLVNDDLLIDFPADTYMHFLKEGIEGDKIKYLLITHPHSDHLYPRDLTLRGGAYAHAMRTPVLEVYGTSVAIGRLSSSLMNVKTHILEPFQTVTLGDYEITPLPARHMPGGEPVIYVIRGDKTLLYAHDTGYFYDEVFSYLAEKKLRLDMISFDCTNVDLPIPDTGSHMGFPNIERVLSRLKELGAVSPETILYVNHFSHNGNPLHDPLCARAAELGLSVSYDGCVVEI